MLPLSLKELLEEPISAVAEREHSMLEHLIEHCSGRVVLFGAGSLGRRALAELRSIGVEPLCISDNNPERWGTLLDGCRVLRPSDATSRYGSDSLFIVTIWNAAHWYVETLAQLREMGCRFISSFAPVYWRFADTFIPFLLNDLPHKVFEDSPSVLAAESLWSDQQSLDGYRSLVYWYATGDASHLPGRPPENSYFPRDLFSISESEVVVDCGAFDGDTIQQMTTLAGSDFGAIYAVEADPLNLDKLDANVRAMPAEVRNKIQVCRCAVGAERKMLRFETTGTIESKFCVKGGVEVDCFPIDDLFSKTAVSMIKMDIEGAENDALRGGRNVIQRDRPILAICVYHTQNDIWRIPLFVREMLPEHKLYLRSYEGDGFQTVLYAIPPARAR